MIDILMATYNGERFLSEQIDSIFCQTYTEWQLIIRDDGSSDETETILNHYISQFPDKIFLLKDSLGNIGPSQSFSVLLSKI